MLYVDTTTGSEEWVQCGACGSTHPPLRVRLERTGRLLPAQATRADDSGPVTLWSVLGALAVYVLLIGSLVAFLLAAAATNPGA